ncbi:MAG: hypothetical protein KKF56_02720 [Nanoarchaeota archaeon]|nr:hypothetical protein [Nanoarchaeota archaeon]
MKEILQELGLNEKESKIYLELLKQKSCTASKIAKLTNLNRTTAYLELENLMKLGLVNYVIKESKRYYQPSSPTKLIEILDSKKEKVKSILPQLNNLHETKEPFNIEVYEGKEGIKTFYQDILNNAKGEVLVYGGTGKALEVLEFEYPHFIKKWVKANLKERGIVNLEAKNILSKTHPKTHMKTKYLPKEYKAEITTVIYNNKIAIQSLQENIYVIVIKDLLLYKTYKNQFELIWRLLK